MREPLQPLTVGMALGLLWLFDETLPVLAVGLVLGLGWLFLAVAVLWGCVHAVRGRPRWFVVRMVTGGAVGATLGALTAVVSWLGEDAQADWIGAAFVCVLLATSGAGWVGLGVAAWYAGYESHPNDTPL